MRFEIGPSHTTWRQDGIVQVLDLGAHCIDTEWPVFTKGQTDMAKKRVSAAKRNRFQKPRKKTRQLAAVTHRLTTHKPNGALPESQEVAPEPVTIGEAMRRAVEELGDVQIDNELAPQQLRELAEVYEDVARRQAAFNQKNEEAKTAKKSLESVTELLLLKVKEFTHPKPLPLFDQTQAEDDRGDMLDAANGD